MSKSKIEWCDKTINPFVGCKRISAGCQHCYAIRFAWWHQAMFGKRDERYRGLVEKKNGRLDWTGKISYFRNRLVDLFRGEHQRIFLNSMGDLFHDEIINNYEDELINLLFNFVALSKNTIIILTKRPENAVKFFGYFDPERLPNLWLGVTVESNDYLWRVEELLKLRPYASKLFLSVEPMLESINLNKFMGLHFTKLDWVIAGQENGPGKREFKEQWAIDLQQQCKSAGVPFFFKGGLLCEQRYEDFPNA
jgi:protein gp37